MRLEIPKPVSHRALKKKKKNMKKPTTPGLLGSMCQFHGGLNFFGSCIHASIPPHSWFNGPSGHTYEARLRRFSVGFEAQERGWAADTAPLA